MPEGETFKFLSAESELKFLKVHILDDGQNSQKEQEDSSNNDRAEVQLQFEYLPNSPAIVKNRETRWKSR
ncbi:MAG: hypothetical protein R3C11_20410 [Planctomycetaceae bacterium]